MKAIGIGFIFIVVFHLTWQYVASQIEDSPLRRPKTTKTEDYLTIVCTVDGIVHGVDKFGSIAWSTSTGLPMLSGQNYAAHRPEGVSLDELDEGDIVDAEKEQFGTGKRKGYSILPSTDGTLIYHSLEGMRKTSVTARLLVEQTPFVSGEGISFTGKKSSRLIKIDTVTGAVLFDTSEDSQPGSPIPVSTDGEVVPVWIGRIDYTLEAVDTTTGHQEFNFTYSELIPLPYGSQYQYGQPRDRVGGKGRGLERDEDQQQVHDLGEEFEVATDVQLEEAEVVGLLDARVTAEGWSVEDVDDFNLAQDAQQAMEQDEGGVVLSGSKVVFPGQEEEPVPRTRVGKVKRKRGRRRRKSRVSMEKRAAATPKPGVAPVRQLELLDAAASGLISTPDGQLFFSDRDGTVIEKFSLNLHSPVFSAFRLQRSSGGADLSSAVHALPPPPNGNAGSSSWGVHAIAVHHRVLTYPLSAELSLSSVSPQQGLAVAGGAGEVLPLEPRKIIVQSPFSQEDRHDSDAAGGPLYVLEVTELEMPGPRPRSSASQDASSAGAGAILLDSPHPTKRELREKSKEGRQRDESLTTKAPAQEKEVHRKNLLRPGVSISSPHTATSRRPLGSLQRRSKGLHAPGSLRLLDGVGIGHDSGGHSLPEGQALDLGWLEAEDTSRGDVSEHSVSTSHGAEEMCAARMSKYYVPASWMVDLGVAALDLHTCPSEGRSPGKQFNPPDKARPLHTAPSSRAARSSGANLHPATSHGMRGSHTLRPDLYEGALFRSDPAVPSLDAQMHLFRGVLSSGQQAHQRAAAAEQNWEGWKDDSKSEQLDDVPLPNLPVVVKPGQRDWLDALALKVLGLVEHFLLNLIAVVIVVAVIFALCVHLVRITPAYAHFLPAGATYTGHLHFAFHAIVRKVLFGMPDAPVLKDPQPMQRTPIAGIASFATAPLTTMDREEGLHESSLSLLNPEAVSIQDIAVCADATAQPSAAVIPGGAADSPQRPMLVETPDETMDADGKRLLRVGALQIHCEHILGYGSHGTTVYRGSLDGRPLAVKRILTQFVRSADREISLLIRSDGHANVVRYFTKEQKSDFVYLGLQLCDMTLKDFVVQVRGIQSSGDAQAVSPAGTVVVSEAIKCGLLQIAMGVAHLHAQRIVHRDIKPQNILLARVETEERAAGCVESGGTPPSTMDDLSLFVLKISDMGLSKQLGRDHHSFSSMSLSIAAGHSTARVDSLGLLAAESIAACDGAAARILELQAAVGTVGWQAPELISHRYFRDEALSPLASATNNFDSNNHTLSSEGDVVLAQLEADEANSDEDGEGEVDVTTGLPAAFLKQIRRERKKRTLTVDVFSLGCVFYFTITRGEHPFGQWFEREANIAAGKLNLDAVQHDPLALDLLTWMLAADPLLRPTSSEVCSHPFFWTAGSKLNFLVEFSDRMEHEPADSGMVLAVEAGALAVLGSRWDRRLDVLLLEDLGKFRKYDTTSVRDLLRVIRNKRHHFHELSAPLKEAIGSIPDNFMSYFDARFPHLVLHCAYVAHRYLSEDALFRLWARGTRSCGVIVTPAVAVPGSIAAQMTQLQASAAAQQAPAPACEDSSAVATGGTDETNKSRQFVDNVVVWQGSALATSLQCAGWWRSASEWATGGADSNAAKKNRPSHLTKSAADSKYRISLCSHWEDTLATTCPMRKKGKCVFAHGPLELRVKEARRNKWGRYGSSNNSTSGSVGGGGASDLASSGGEDTFGAARNVSKGRSGADGGTRPGLSIGATQPRVTTTNELAALQPNVSHSGRLQPVASPDRYVRAGGGQQQEAPGYGQQVPRFAPPSYGDPRLHHHQHQQLHHYQQQQALMYHPHPEPQLEQRGEGEFLDPSAPRDAGYEYGSAGYQLQHQFYQNYGHYPPP